MVSMWERLCKEGDMLFEVTLIEFPPLSKLRKMGHGTHLVQS